MMGSKLFTLLTLAAFAALWLPASGRQLAQAAPRPAAGSQAPCTTVYQQLSTNPDLSVLKAAVDAAGLKAALDDPALVATVFAPSNDAFNRTTRDADTTPAALVQGSPQVLSDLLKFHVVPGTAVKAADLKTGLRFSTLGGGEFVIESQKIKPDPKYAGCAGLDIHIDTYADEDPEPRVCDLPACAALVHVVDYLLVLNNPGVRSLLPKLEYKTALTGQAG